MVADRKPTRAQLRSRHEVSKKWDKLFAEHLPGYNPYLQATNCTFNTEAAEHVCDFFETFLQHPAPTAAVPAGSPFILRPWQQAHVGCFFGWKKANGLRRYRKILIYVGKKTGKSSETAGVIPYVMTQEEGSMMRLCAVAASRDQTTNVFDPLVEMIRKQPALARVLKIYGGTVGGQMKSVVYAKHNHRLICLAADAGTADGKPAKAAFVDELHRFPPNGEMYEVAERNTSAQAEPIVWVTTTADWKRDSPCNRELAFAHAVQKNKGDPDAIGWAPWYLPVVYETTDKDDYKDLKTWYKANPNLGQTVTEEYMADMVREAKDDPAKLNSFLRLYMNRVTRSEVTWFPEGAWDKCYDKDIRIEDLLGQTCWGAIDLGSTSDMTVLVLLFPLDDGRVFLWSHFWVPEALTKEGSHKEWDKYASWVRGGHMTATPGNATDYGFIRKRLEELATQHSIREVAIDRSWGGVHVAQELEDDGHKVFAFNQSTRAISPFAKQFFTWVTTGKVVHDGNPVHAWQAGHVMVKCDAYDGIRPVKPSPEAKIDAMVCDIMALGSWQQNPDRPSVYETRGMLEVSL